MKCTICGQPALPRAMLCQPCRAALKRARYMSVQASPPVSILGAGRPRRRPRESAATPRESAAAVAPTGQPPKRRSASLRRAVVSGTAAIAALAIVTYLGRQPAPPAAPAAPQAPAALARPANAPSVADVPAGDARAAPAVRAGKAAAAVAGAPRLAAPPVDARSAADATATQAAAVALQRGPAVPATREVTLDSFGPAPMAVRTAAPPVARVAPAAVRPPPPPDRWASMRQALAACDREGGLSGFLCDQRVRLDGCEGYWGRVADCPGPPENPGGQ